jgi:sulfate permease, SulP family
MIFMKKMGDATAMEAKVSSLHEIKEEICWLDESIFPPEYRGQVFIKHLDGPLFFGATSDIQMLASQIPSAATHVILRMDKVSYIDQTGLYTLEDIILNLEENDIHTMLIKPAEQPLLMMTNIGLIPDLIPESHIFDCFESCIKNISSIVQIQEREANEKSV